MRFDYRNKKEKEKGKIRLKIPIISARMMLISCCSMVSPPPPMPQEDESVDATLDPSLGAFTCSVEPLPVIPPPAKDSGTDTAADWRVMIDAISCAYLLCSSNPNNFTVRVTISDILT
jgi:hypothetical protein